MSLRSNRNRCRSVSRFVTAAWTGLLLAGIARGDGRKPANPVKDSGKTFVATLNFTEILIEEEETKRIRYKVDGDEKEHVLQRSVIKVFDKESVSDEPLQFLDDPDFDPGEKVRIARAGRWTYLMRSGHSASPHHSVPSEALEDSAAGGTHIPTTDEVKRVMKLDSKENQKEFNALDDATRREVLIAAGNIAGVKDVPTKVSIKTLNQHIDLFEKRKIRDWLVGMADDAGGEKLVYNLKTPRAKWEIVKMAFAGLSPADQKTAKTIAVKLKSRGPSSLKPEETQFVTRNPLIFGGR